MMNTDLFKVHRYSISWSKKITAIKLMPNLKKILFIILNLVAYYLMSENILKNV